MNKPDQDIARSVFNTLRATAKSISWLDQMVLANAFKKNQDFDTLPAAQQELFLKLWNDLRRAGL